MDVSLRKVEIVIPCFNEEGAISKLVEVCQSVNGRSGVTFILVDNGSTDNTWLKMTEHSPHEAVRFIRLSENIGYGNGIFAGLKESNAAILGWTHADLQTNPADIIEGVTLMYSGFQFVKGLRSGRPWTDYIFSSLMAIFASIVFLSKLKDINAQPTLFTREFFLSLENPPKDFSLDLYALVEAKHKGLEIGRFPVFFHPREFGKSSWNNGLWSKIKMSVRTAKYILKLRIGF